MAIATLGAIPFEGCNDERQVASTEQRITSEYARIASHALIASSLPATLALLGQCGGRVVCIKTLPVIEPICMLAKCKPICGNCDVRTDAASPTDTDTL